MPTCCSEFLCSFVSLKNGALFLSALGICVYIKVYFSLSQSKKSVCKGYLQHISVNHCLADMSSFLLVYCCCLLFSVRPHECSARFRCTKNSPYPNHSLDSLTAVKYSGWVFSYLSVTTYAALQGTQKLSVDNLIAWLLLRWLSAAELCPKNYHGT